MNLYESIKQQEEQDFENLIIQCGMMLLPLVNPYDHSREQMFIQYNNNLHFHKITKYLAHSLKELKNLTPEKNPVSAENMAAIMSMRSPISLADKI